MRLLVHRGDSDLAEATVVAWIAMVRIGAQYPCIFDKYPPVMMLKGMRRKIQILLDTYAAEVYFEGVFEFATGTTAERVSMAMKIFLVV